jgi:hypothetical protein
MAMAGASPMIPKVEARPGPHPSFAVVLEPPMGAFDVRPTTAAAPGARTLLTISGAAPAGIEAMRPTDVAASVRTTPAGGQVLNLYIATGGTAPPATVAPTVPLPTVDGAAWTLIVSGQHLFQDLIVDGFNNRSQHLKLEAVGPDAGTRNGWFARSVHRVLFQGTVSWGEGPPFARQHAQFGVELRGSPEGSLAISTYRSKGSNVDPQISVEQSYHLACDGAAGAQQLRLMGSSAVVQGTTGIAERTLVPIARALLGQELKDDLESVSLSACTDLLKGNFGLADCQPVIRQGGIPGDLVLIGDLLPAGRPPAT